jgi:flagellar secretion chaperone FliS
MVTNGARAYRNTEVVTADPGKLVLMCYEGAIFQLKIAKTKFQEKKFEDKGKALIKALDFIQELASSLDFEKGDLIARNLDSIYNYVTRRIHQADVTKDLGGIDEAIGLLAELLSAWKEIIGGPGLMITPAPVQVVEKRRMGLMANYLRA